MHKQSRRPTNWNGSPGVVSLAWFLLLQRVLGLMHRPSCFIVWLSPACLLIQSRKLHKEVGRKQPQVKSKSSPHCHLRVTHHPPQSREPTTVAIALLVKKQCPRYICICSENSLDEECGVYIYISFVFICWELFAVNGAESVFVISNFHIFKVYIYGT